jgi:hypothetical protein
MRGWREEMKHCPFSEVLRRTDRTPSNMDERHKGQEDGKQMELLRRLRDQWRHIATGHRSLDDRLTNTTPQWMGNQSHYVTCTFSSVKKILNVTFAMSDRRNKYYIRAFRADICVESERFAVCTSWKCDGGILSVAPVDSEQYAEIGCQCETDWYCCLAIANWLNKLHSRTYW